MPLPRPILRRGFYTAAAVSSLLLLATLILWLESYRYSELLAFYTTGSGGKAVTIGGASGRAILAYEGALTLDRHREACISSRCLPEGQDGGDTERGERLIRTDSRSVGGMHP